MSFYFSRATPILQVYHMTWLIEHLILRRKRAYRTLGQIPMPRGCALKDWELIQLIFLRKWSGWSRSPPIMIRRSRSHFGLNSDGLPFHFNFLPAAPFNSPSLFSLEICNSSLIVPPDFLFNGGLRAFLSRKGMQHLRKIQSEMRLAGR